MRATVLFALLGAASARVITKPVTLNSREKLLAGGSARFGAQLIMYPADALRTLAQTRTGAKTLADLGYKTLISGCATTRMGISMQPCASVRGSSITSKRV